MFFFLTHFSGRKFRNTACASLFLLFLVLCPCLQLSAQTAQLPEFEIVTESFPPYQFRENGKIKGLAVDLLILMLQRAGSVQNADDISMLPWARGYFIALNHKNGLLFSTTRTKEREKLFKWVGPIFQNTMVLIAKKQPHIKITQPEDLRNYIIGTVREDVGELYLKSLGVSLPQLARNNTNVGNIQMLGRGRVNLIAQSWNLFIHDAQSIGIDPQNFEPVFVLHTDDLYYTLHRETPDWIVNTLQKIFDQLKAEGVVERLMNDYGVFR
ncbi:MAG: ABC transporter substrate-binding protein [Desulfobulbaceae bacterium]|nr:ABC transporter substrate-binding protein [Desulfobulbaceae bacterium]